MFTLNPLLINPWGYAEWQQAIGWSTSPVKVGSAAGRLPGLSVDGYPILPASRNAHGPQVGGICQVWVTCPGWAMVDRYSSAAFKVRSGCRSPDTP